MRSGKKSLLRRLAQIPDDKILFSDEKLFTVGESSNRQNNRILAYSSNSISSELRLIDRVQRPLSIMVWAGVSADSRTNLIFIPRGVRINTETYKEMILDTEIKDAGQKLFNNESWLFQQDSAPAHTSKGTKSWLQGQNIDFLTKEEWPPCSPDLNPLAFSVWENLENRACSKPHKNLESLQATLKEEWLKIPQEELRNAVLLFRDRIPRVVKEKGGYIE